MRLISAICVCTLSLGGGALSGTTSRQDTRPPKETNTIQRSDEYYIQKGIQARKEHAVHLYLAALYAASLEKAAHDKAVYIWITASQSSHVEQSSGACGGDLPPCWIMMRESRGQIRAKNPSSSASGKWQILDSTWNGYGGYAHASDAPESVQDAKARSMALCNWQPPNYCAG
jgi:hypothetical protein